MSRTGIHGGLRRGTAAAAVGAVLVLTTGVQASQADDSGDGSSITLEASVLTVPGALIPALGETLEPTATGTPATTASPAETVPELPAPDVPLPSLTDPALSEPLPSGPAPSEAAPTQTAAAAPQLQAQDHPAPAAPAQGVRQSTAPAGPPEPAAPPAPAAPAQDAGAALPAAGPASGEEPEPERPAALGPSLQAASMRVPQAAILPGSAAPVTGARSNAAVVAAQPELQGAMVWLGAGLVVLGSAAGLVYFRLRRL